MKNTKDYPQSAMVVVVVVFSLTNITMEGIKRSKILVLLFTVLVFTLISHMHTSSLLVQRVKILYYQHGKTIATFWAILTNINTN